MEKRWIVIATLAAAASAIGVPAAAHTSLAVQIGVPGPVYAQPVYPQPVYAQPVYAQPVYSAPAPVVVYEPHAAYRTWGPGHRQADGHGWARQRVYAMGDRDGDGVPNRWDRAPANPYRH